MPHTDKLSIFQLMLIVLVTVSSSQAQYQGCLPNEIKILTQNQTLLPHGPANIIADAFFTSGVHYPPSFVNFGPDRLNVWCITDDRLPPNLMGLPAVRLTFTEEVVVVGMISGAFTYPSGTLSGQREYVTRFTFEYSLGPNQLTFIMRNGTTEAKEFTVDEDSLNQIMYLEGAILADSIRLKPLERTSLDNVTCWSMALLGCLPSEAIIEQNITERCEEVTDTTPVTSATTESTLVTAQVVMTTRQLIEIVLPAAAAVILAVLLIVLAGVCVCVKVHHKGHYTVNMETGGVSINNYMVNEGDDPSELRERAPTIRNVQNELYDLTRDTELDDDVIAPEYEQIQAKPAVSEVTMELDESNRYEIIRHISKDDDDDMVDNDTYNMPFMSDEQTPDTSKGGEGNYDNKDSTYSAPFSEACPKHITTLNNVCYGYSENQ